MSHINMLISNYNDGFVLYFRRGGVNILLDPTDRGGQKYFDPFDGGVKNILGVVATNLPPPPWDF
jgi:hypothetical protein